MWSGTCIHSGLGENDDGLWNDDGNGEQMDLDNEGGGSEDADFEVVDGITREYHEGLTGMLMGS